MNTFLKLSGALAHDDALHADPAAMVAHNSRAQRPSYVAQRRQRRRDRISRL